MRHVPDAALSARRFERAIENRQMLGLQSALHGRTVVLDVLDGVEFFNVRDDVLDGFFTVAQAAQGIRHAAVDDLQHAATGEQFVFHQGNVRFDTSRIAVHEEGDGAGRREHGDLRIAIAVLFAFGERTVPRLARLGLEVIEFRAGLDLFHRGAVQLDHPEHGFDIVLGDRVRHSGATRIAIASKGTDVCGDFRALLVSMAGHDGRDGTRQRTAFIGIIRQTVAHAERTEVRKAEAEGAEDMGVFRDVLGRIARIVHEDFLRGDVNADRRLETFDVKLAVFPFELHEVQRGQVAGGVVDENVFAARVRGVDRLRAFAGMPLLDGAVVLDAGVAADMRAFSDLVQQGGRIFLLQRFVAAHRTGPPFLAGQGRFKKLVAGADGKIFVLVHHTAIGIAIVRTVIALLDQRPGLLLFLLLGVDEFLDVTVPVAQRVHLGRAARFAAGLHDIRHLVINLQEAHRAARTATAAQLLAAGTDRGQVGAGAGTILEEHGLAVSEVHDVFHVVLDALDEARTALRIFVLGRSTFSFLGFRVVKPVALAGFFADTVLVIEADVEPYRRIERAVLVQAKPGQLLVKDFTICLAEITVRNTPVRNCPGNAVDKLAHGSFALGGILFAVKIFRYDNFGRQYGPRFRHFDIFLLEDDLAGIVGDFGGAPVPFDLVEGLYLGIAEHPGDW